MNKRQSDALLNFASAIEELKQSGVIRSHRYLGDIAEFLCADLYGISLEENMREVGHDGMLEKIRVQIKYAGGEKTNMDLGDPTKYDEIYMVLGKGSKVRPSGSETDFLVYKMTSDEVKSLSQQDSGKYSCGITQFRGRSSEEISLTEAEPAAIEVDA